MKIKFVLAILLSLGLQVEFLAAKPEFEFSPGLREAHEEILHLRLKSALTAIQQEKSRKADNAMIVLLENYLDFFRIFTNESSQEFEQLFRQRDKRIEYLAAADNRSPYYLYSQAEVYLQWALLQLKMENPLAAAKDIKTALELIDMNIKFFPEFMPNKKTKGVLQIIAGSASKNYHWGSRVLGLEGSIGEGIATLKEVMAYGAKNPDFEFNREMQVWYALMLLSLGHDDPADWNVLNTRYLDYQKNPLAAYILAQMCLETGQSAKGLAILERTPSSAEYQAFPALDYLRGLCYVYKLDARAKNNFERYLSTYKGDYFIKDTHWKLALYAASQGDKAGFDKHLALLQKEGSSYMTVDLEALEEAQLGFMPPAPIAKARLYHQGGYYEQAYKELQGKKENEFKELYHQVEFNYRAGLSLKMLKRNSEALRYLDQAQKLGKAKPWYFACAAAYYSGLVWEDRGERSKAKEAYEACLKLKPKMYKDILHNQAKRRLEALK